MLKRPNEDGFSMATTTTTTKRICIDGSEPGINLFGETFADKEHAHDALRAAARPFGISFALKRTNYAKKTKLETIYFACSKGSNQKVKCSCYFVAHYSREGNACWFDKKKSNLKHTGHALRLKTFNPKRGEDALAEVLVEHDTAESMRIAMARNYPPERLPQGLRDAHTGPHEYYRLQTINANNNYTKFKLDACTRLRVCRQVERFPDVKTFRSVLHSQDAAYFDWWMQGKRATCVAFLRVKGANAIDVQLSLSYIQEEHGVLEHGARESIAKGRYVVFHSPADTLARREAFLAINEHALRAYRMHTFVMHMAIGCSMPVAPLLMQGWIASPHLRSEDSLHSLAMKTTLDFLYAQIKDIRKAFVCSGGMFEVYEQGFVIYKWLPDFLRLLHDDDFSMDVTLVMAAQYVVRDDSLYSWIASFLLQKEVHTMMTNDLHRLYWHFNLTSRHGPALRAKYPYAYAVLDYHFQINGEACLPILMENRHAWGNLPPHPDKFPPHFFLFQLCFEEELLDVKVRTMIAKGLQVNMEFRSMLPQHWTDAKSRDGPDHLRATHANYAIHYSKPSPSDFETMRLCPFSFDSSVLYPTQSLYRVLRGMDALRHDSNFAPIYIEDVNEDDFNLDKIAKRTGSLYIPDPVHFATKQLNLPVACVRRSEQLKSLDKPKHNEVSDVVFFEDALWVWPLAEHQFQGDQMELVEARVLVRDVRYYMEYFHSTSSSALSMNTLEKEQFSN